jgi:hypothetical protein
MPRTFAWLLLLALVSPGRAFAGPPEGPSGRMVLDEVADGLRKYQKETDPETRVKWLAKLAPTQDPRVAVAIGEALGPAICVNDKRAWLPLTDMLLKNFPIPEQPRVYKLTIAWYWWKENEADLRRRAAQLPQ